MVWQHGETTAEMFICNLKPTKECTSVVSAKDPYPAMSLVSKLSPVLCYVCITSVTCCAVVVHTTERCGGVVMEAACVIELPFLHGRTAIGGIPLFVLVEKEGA